tara:strand:+ start:620 stop:778 length:159 start_codon:yes stop_codon:yes gene_type:complete
MTDLTLLTLETGGYALYRGNTFLISAESIAEVGEYVAAEYGADYNLELGWVA